MSIVENNKNETGIAEDAQETERYCNMEGECTFLSDTAEESTTEEMAAARLQSKSVTWGRLDSGDCTLRNARLTLYSDGLADFTASVSTDDSGDVWLFRALRLLNARGEELGRIGQFNGPRMGTEHFDYFVSRTRPVNPLVYSGQLFAVIARVSMVYHC
ncbi:MAG: hypothetical protein EOP24_42755 [Hyphomicrobiales bacterium]|nr:MAG: hypothetical protein EOP24_42755 [Hyphomicrobiales bacterium]